MTATQAPNGLTNLTLYRYLSEKRKMIRRIICAQRNFRCTGIFLNNSNNGERSINNSKNYNFNDIHSILEINILKKDIHACKNLDRQTLSKYLNRA